MKGLPGARYARGICFSVNAAGKKQIPHYARVPRASLGMTSPRCATSKEGRNGMVPPDKNHGAIDIGYWVGYRIAGAYYARVTDKRAAVRDLLELRDAD